MYTHGIGVAADHAQAVRWYRKAAEQGNASAQSNLGFMYHEGQGVERDFEDSAQWFNRAAEQGDATAQFYLGLMYVKGEGVDKDPVEAHKWAIIASAMSPPGRIRGNAEKARKLFKQTMTIGEIANARRAAKAWMAKHGGGK